METLNETGLEVGWLPGKARPHGSCLTVIVKGTFRLQPGDAAALVDDSQDPPAGDGFYDDDPAKGCRYESDLVVYKPRADLLLTGTCHAPNGTPVQACRTSFGVGQRVKSLAVFGDRFWTQGEEGPRPSNPRPFTAMPLDYRYSFGGQGYDRNPLGKGSHKVQRRNGQVFWPLPNIEDMQRRIASPMDRPDPAGFGPLGRLWAQRLALLARPQEEAGAGGGAPATEEINWHFMNAAPPDQQVPGYLQGDEKLLFENLHPEHAHYRSSLPGIRVRSFFDDLEGMGSQAREVPMKLDTLWVDMDEEKLVLVWRGLTPVRSPETIDRGCIMAVVEPMAEQPRPAAHYQHRMAELTRKAPADGAPAPAATAAGEASPAAETVSDGQPDDAALEAEVRSEIEKTLRDMSDHLQRVQIEPDTILDIVFSEDPEAALTAFLADRGVDAVDGERAVNEAREKMRQAFSDHGLDPSVLDDEFLSPSERNAAESPETLATRARAGNLTGASLRDQDLSGLDLKQADLRSADLSGVNFQGADLSRAELSDSNLSSANLAQAKLADAVLDRSDLSGALLRQADLTGASLNEARGRGADFTGAGLNGVSAADSEFAGANLTAAQAGGAGLARANFTNARLDRANFDKACLSGAVLDGVSGAGVSMSGADLTGVTANDGCNFSGACFRKIAGDGSSWYDANLSQTDFTGSDLKDAVLVGASLKGSTFHAVDLKNGRLTEADLSGAAFTMVNLFRADLRGAKLVQADLRGSNCFGADFLGADTTAVRLEHANIKNTLLAQRRTGRPG